MRTIKLGLAILFSIAIASCERPAPAKAPAPDTTAPTVSSTSPASSATGVAVNGAIAATFSENMDAATISTATFTLNNGVTGAVTYSGTTATLTPSANLTSNTAYTAVITTAVKDAVGNAMASNRTWTFTTGTVPDTTPPTASSVSSANSATGVAVNAAITATFSKNMDTATISTATLTLNNGVTGAIALNNAQDGMAGRDANAATDSNTDSKLGFTSLTGGCVQDNVTGLMWEVKTADGGLRDWNKTYTNYDSTTALQKWNGAAYVASTQTEIDAETNSIGFKNSVNSQGLCDYSDWRLPTADELKSILYYGVASPEPTIDTTWFPNTQGGVFWSASPNVDNPYGAWYVYFSIGLVDGSVSRSYGGYVRLVRAGQ